MTYNDKFRLFLESLHHYDNVLVTGILEEYTAMFEGLTEDIRVKYYPKIPVDVFNTYIAADPTGGKYQKWILNLLKGGLKAEDLYKVNDYLKIFDKYKAKLPVKDINQLKSLSQLFTLIEPIKLRIDGGDKSVESSNEQARLIKADTDKIYEDSKWVILSPKTQESACYYGKGTQWCTAANASDNKFNDYNSQGRLYIIINKSHEGQGGKWQFHKETSSFMDSNDAKVSSLDDIFPIEILFKISELYGIGNTIGKINDDTIIMKILEKYSDAESFKEFYGALAHLIKKNKLTVVKYVIDNNLQLLDPDELNTTLIALAKYQHINLLRYLLSKIYDSGLFETITINPIRYIIRMCLKDENDSLYNELTSDSTSNSISDTSLGILKGLLNECDKVFTQRECIVIVTSAVYMCIEYNKYDVIFPYLLSLYNLGQYNYNGLLLNAINTNSGIAVEHLIKDSKFYISKNSYDIMLELFSKSKGKIIDILKQIDPSKVTSTNEPAF